MELNSAVLWLGLLILFLVIEAVTLGLTTIWFAGGAFVSFLAALLHTPLPVQGVLFFAVSLVLLFFTRPVAVRFMNQKTEKTNVDSLPGEKALVTETIENLKGTGRVKVKGADWTARTPEDGKVIAAGTVVTVQRVQGVKLIVENPAENPVEGNSD